MNNKNIFNTSLYLSIFIQITSGIVDLIALLTKIDSSYNIIKQLLFLEFIVQIIEGIFYMWLFFNLHKVTNVTPNRYIDWGITTPTMLIQLIMYLIYLSYKEKNMETSSLDFITILLENSRVITYVLFLNWLMLLFGYLGEMKYFSTTTSVFLGFIPFFIYYIIIYINYAVNSNLGRKVFWYFFIIWLLYGIAALLPYYIKNSFYNILDLFSKNFFGLYFSYMILTSNYTKL